MTMRLFVACLASALLAATPPQRDRSIAITNVTVVDAVSGRESRGWTVVTSGARIAAAGRSAAIPRDAVRIDGSGKFLIPGLWDMHSHHQASGKESLPLYLSNGVVGTRDMGSDVDFILPLRDAIARGEILGPEIVAAGPILDDRPPDWPFRRHVRNAEEARTAVRDLKARGVDFIKVHDGTPRDAFFAIADEAPKLGLPFAGHVPSAVTVEEAANARIKSIEHLANFRVFTECAGNRPYTATSCQRLFDILVARHVWQTPTIAFFQVLPDVFSGQPLPHAEQASQSLLRMTEGNRRASHLDEQALAYLRRQSRTSMTAIHDLFSRGALFLAGCDGLVPGYCLHDELRMFTEAGFTPLQALQTATINPAQYFGREHTQGTIAAGTRADLVLLDADPLSDIGNTRRISAVIVRGRLVEAPRGRAGD